MCSRLDSGVITDRGLLPVLRVVSGGITELGARASVYIGPLRCGARQFGDSLRLLIYFFVIYLAPKLGYVPTSAKY